MDRDPPHEHSSSASHDASPTKHEGEDGMPSTSDFVKKLYKYVLIFITIVVMINVLNHFWLLSRMLEDQSFADVVSWGPQGDCFVVKDMNEFTKSILPRMFKHSNFASFVRQLNKYDFHKVCISSVPVTLVTPPSFPSCPTSDGDGDGGSNSPSPPPRSHPRSA